MAKGLFKIILGLHFIILFERCAQVAPLNGGKRDTEAPQLIEAFPLNKTVNFNANQILLKFNERIKLQDLQNQLIISPKLNFEPEITTDGKKVIISFTNHTLLPNTTYRFYFGKAIIDMTEGNSTNNFEYIFSTGNFIDSLKINGTISNSFNNKTEKDIIIGLYNLSEDIDSLPYKKTPNYITRSSENGEFTFNNLPNTKYKIFGFFDKNKNYQYDGDVEQIAYLSKTLNLVADTTIQLKLFKEEPAKVFVKKINTPYYGYSEIILNKKSLISLTTFDKSEIKNIFETKVGIEKDTISFYYKNLKDSLALLVENLSFQKIDTLKVQLPKLPAIKKKFTNFTINAIAGKVEINQPLQLTFASWMDTSKIDLSKIKFISTQDSLIQKEKINYTWLNVNTLTLHNKLKEGVSYVLKLDTSAFFDKLGAKSDSCALTFRTESEKELGKILLKLLFNKKQSYLVQLINSKEQIVKEKFISLSLSSSNAQNIDFTGITAGTYQIKIVFDVNENKKWDTGNLNLKIQPEDVFIYPKPIKVLPDWEIEEEISVKK